MSKIFTLGREYGSRGHVVGETLAKRLDIPYYDEALLQEAAKSSGLSQEILSSHEERPSNSFLYSLVMDIYAGSSYAANSYMDMPLDHKVFLALFDTIKRLASQGDCVIVGRCADYALADRPDVMNIFIHADLEDRVRTVSERENLTESKARDRILKMDKQRASHYNYYTNKKWGVCATYDLCLNTSKISIDDCVDVILDFRNRMEMKR